MPVQPNKAIVGDNAFAHEAGIHQDGVLKAAITYEIMTPQSIGRASNELVLGKHSGRHAFRERLAELGFALEGEPFEEAFRRFKELADAKKTIFNEDLEAIVADAVVRTDERFQVEEMTVLSGTFAKPTATVELRVDGQPRKATALGIGPVDAIFKAIAELTETKSELERFQVNAITGGMDALGEVSVTVAEDGRRVIGNGADPDIIVASARAYVHALNKLEWHKRRHGVGGAEGDLSWQRILVLAGRRHRPGGDARRRAACSTRPPSARGLSLALRGGADRRRLDRRARHAAPRRGDRAGARLPRGAARRGRRPEVGRDAGRPARPRRGLLRIRKELGLFANLRPATVFPALADASTLRARDRRGHRPAGRARADGRALLRRAARPGAGRRAPRGAQHDGVRRGRDRAHRARRVRGRAPAPQAT